MTKLIRYIAAEKEKIRDLDAKKKAAYILHYYWLWIIGIGSGLFFLFYILFHVFFTVKDYWFYGMFANTSSCAASRVFHRDNIRKEVHSWTGLN